MGDIVLTAIKAFNRSEKYADMFMKVLSTSNLFTLAPAKTFEPAKPLERLTVIREKVSGQPESYAPFFSDEKIAAGTLDILLKNQANTGRQIDVISVNGATLFSYIDHHDLSAYYNPKSLPNDRKFFSRDMITELFLIEWENGFDKQPSPKSRLNKKLKNLPCYRH